MIQEQRPFPNRVVIENTTACNAHCTICPREKLKRKIEFMGLETFQKLLDDCVQAGAKKLSLHNFGEPLLDRYLSDKIRYAKSKGIKETYIVTNASLLSKELSEKLISAGLDKIKISFYGIDQEEYEKVHIGLNYEKTIKNICDLLKLKKQVKSKTPEVTLRYIGSISNFIRFYRQWSKYRGLCKIITGRLHNYTTGRNYNPISRIKRPNYLKSCRYVKKSVLYILVNGDVVPCCYDFNGVLFMGNALKQNIKQIWNGELFRDFRLAHKNHQFEKYPLCANCDKLNYILI